MTVTRFALTAIFCFGLSSCGFDDTLEGCGAKADALAAEGLAPSDSAVFDLAGLSLLLPQGYLYRIRGDVLELFEPPAVYCDSGEWGINGDGFVRLQVHAGVAPTDPFRDFPDTHRGHAREQISLGVGPLNYSFAHNTLNWHVHAYFSNMYHPHVIFMYLQTKMQIAGQPIGLSAHYFPSDAAHGLPEIIATIDKVIQDASRAALESKH